MKMQNTCTQFSSTKVSNFFKKAKAQKLAKETKVIQRKPRKISPVNLILSHWQMISQGDYSFDNWAIQLELITGKRVSGQAVWKRMNSDLVSLVKKLLDISFKENHGDFIHAKLFNYFREVYIQDATHFKLPSVLRQLFPGSYSKSGGNTTAKIQATFNLKKGLFSSFKLTSFRDTDQKDSSRILAVIQENDLIIRDLGYFVLNVFENIVKKKAFFLSRLKFGVTILSPTTKKPINITAIVKKQKGIIDIPVCLGKKGNLECRLVVLPVPPKVANERRRKAKADRNKKARHNKTYLERLSYTFYITNVTKERWSTKQVEQAYRGRWYIEIIFKAWKSHLKMKNIIPDQYINQERAEFLFYNSLLMINVLINPVYLLASKLALKAHKYLSIIKTCSFISKNMMAFTCETNINERIKLIVNTCQYDSRNDRTNAIEFLQLS